MTERDLFIEAIQEKDPRARAALLERRCQGDEALRTRIEGLLQKAEEAGSFLEPPDDTTTP